VRFGILGPLEARDGAGRPITLRHPAERRLLLRLLAADGRPVPVERLAAEVGTPIGVSTALFDRIAGLRRRLEPGRAPGAPGRLLVTTAGGYALLPGFGPGVELDAGTVRDDREAARLLVVARAELAADRVGAAGERASEALGLWRGPALVDAGDAPWADVARHRLALLAADARLIASAALAVDRPADARAALDGAQAEQPADGRLWALRAATELALEQDVEALRVLRRARLALEAEGVPDRGPALRAMEAAILRADHDGARALCRRIALGDLAAPAVAGDAPGRLMEGGADLVAPAVAGDAPGRLMEGGADLVAPALVERIRSLPGRSRRLVELLAVTVEGARGDGGGGTDRDLLARAAGVPSAALADHLDPAVALGLVAANVGAIRFRHPAAAAAVLNGLTPFRRRCTRRLVDQAARAVGLSAG